MSRVLVAMSGGVDSSVAAAMLRADGHDVIGATLKLRQCDEGAAGASCCSADAEASALAVAGLLGIPHYVLDRRREFDDLVLRSCWDEYSRGRTPNPCVACNEKIKFGLLLESARGLGASLLATGHYARLVRSGAAAPELRRGRDRDRDQSYFLFSLDASQRSAALFPLGDLTKREVREEAARLGLPSADRPESRDICLDVDEAGFAERLRRMFDRPAIVGDLVDSTGQRLGRHDGIHLFTIGQRHGLGLALGRPAWIRSIDPAAGSVAVAVDPAELESSAMLVAGARWAVGPRPGRFEVQIRYRHRPAEAVIAPVGGDRVEVRFDRPQRSITPGQAAVFYEGDRVVGGGWIERAAT